MYLPSAMPLALLLKMPCALLGICGLPYDVFLSIGQDSAL